jgi:phage terminase small subunit
MLRGRKPIPADLQRLRGNPGKGRLRVLVARLSPSKTDPPPWLKGPALKEWQRIVPELHRQGLLTTLDMAMVAGYCECTALIARVKKQGDDRLLAKALAELRAFSNRLGLSPADRGHVLPAGKEEEGAASLLD